MERVMLKRICGGGEGRALSGVRGGSIRGRDEGAGG